MIETLRQQKLHHRNLVIYVGAGLVTLLIAGVYFTSIFKNKILVNTSKSINSTSPTKNLLDSFKFIGKTAGSVVQEEFAKEPEVIAPLTEAPQLEAEAVSELQLTTEIPDESNPYTEPLPTN